MIDIIKKEVEELKANGIDKFECCFTLDNKEVLKKQTNAVFDGLTKEGFICEVIKDGHIIFKEK